MCITMDAFDAFFPYSEYRPHQREMLEFAAQCAREGGIAMVDAPTGSGKSSVVASLLAFRNERKVIIAVRTISQLNTFIRELALNGGLTQAPARLPVPTTVQETVMRRVGQVSVCARQILEAASVLDTQLDFGLLQMTSGRDEVEVGDLLPEFHAIG